MAVVTSMRGLAALAVLLAATGCQGLADQGTKGPTLLTIRGQITLAPGTHVDGKLRLAALTATLPLA